MHISMKKLREHRPCRQGWTKILRHLSLQETDDDLVPIEVFLRACGLDDTLWSLRAVEGYEREVRQYGIWTARQVDHMLIDTRSRDALDVTQRYLNGAASESEMRQAVAMAETVAMSLNVSDPMSAAAAAAWATSKAASVAVNPAGVSDASGAAQEAAALAAEPRGSERARQAMRDAQEAELRRVAEDARERYLAEFIDEDEPLDL